MVQEARTKINKEMLELRRELRDAKYRLSNLTKDNTPKWIRRVGTFLVTTSAALAGIFAKIGKEDWAMWAGAVGVIGKGLLSLFGEDK